MEEVLFDIEGSIATITMNRADKRNALNDALIAALKAALTEADSNNVIRAVAIKGNGQDFCSGADLSALQKIAESSIIENMEDAQDMSELFSMIRKVRVPVVAVVHGRALAGGCGLATACDIVLAGRSARFGYPEVKIGFVPAMVTAILRRNVSEKRAFELVARGAEINAEEAERIGLINRVFDDDKFEDEARSYLAGFSKVSRSALMLTKRLIYQMDGMTFDAAIQAGVDVNTIARMTEDCQQGIARFLRK